MPGSTTTNASKVGLLILAFIAMGVYGLRFFGGSVGAGSKIYFISTADATGISEGTKVLLAGVPIGMVTKVSLAVPDDEHPNNRAKIQVSLKQGFSLPKNCSAVIPTSLTGLGDSYLQIIPDPNSVGLEPEGQTIYAIRPSPLDALFPNSKQTLADLDKTLVATTKILNDQKLKDGIQGTLAASKQTLLQFSKLAQTSQQLIADNRVQLNSALSNASEAVKNVNQASLLALNLIKKGDFVKETDHLLKSLTATSERAQKLIDHLDAFVNDPNIKKNIDASLNNVTELTAQGKSIAANVQTITDNGKAISAQAITLTQQATEVATEAKNLVIKLQGLVDKVSGKVDGFSPKTKTGPIESDISVFHDFGPSHNRLDANFKIPLAKNDVYLGVYDALGTNKLNAQLGTRISPKLELRYGAYAGVPGLGVDYQVSQRLMLVSDLFNLNYPVFNMRAKYKFGGGFVGWLGYDQLFNHNQFTIGFGLEK